MESENSYVTQWLEKLETASLSTITREKSEHNNTHTNSVNIKQKTSNKDRKRQIILNYKWNSFNMYVSQTSQLNKTFRTIPFVFKERGMVLKKGEGCPLVRV